MSRAWGSGGSTSESEKRAAEASGLTAGELPVNFSLPPEIASAWLNSVNRPGVSLVGADLRPQMMVTNVRATIFPHLQQQVQATVALSLTRQAWNDVSDYERLHAWRCGAIKPKLKMVIPIEEEGHEKRSTAATLAATGTRAATSANAQAQATAPPISAIENFLGNVWSGRYGQLPSRHSSAAEQRFLSTERWVIERCDGQQIYRVQYFGNGDRFWAQVAPTNFATVAAMVWVRFKQIFEPPR